ncbi:hypothetical protein F5880DRAFT_194993 [Lentinula raphanica]|nr:hypothetical protein F5880DRAFT_194993 [Lentinula raphanica]
MCSGILVPSSPLIFLCCRTRSLCSREPIGMISVLFMLNLAPDARHHSFRIVSRSPKSSSFDRYTVVSSAKKVAISRFTLLGMSIPFSVDLRSDSPSDSIAISNRMHDKGSPCLTPLVTLNGFELLMPLTYTWVFASLYSAFTVLMNCSGFLLVKGHDGPILFGCFSKVYDEFVILSSACSPCSGVRLGGSFLLWLGHFFCTVGTANFLRSWCLVPFRSFQCHYTLGVILRQCQRPPGHELLHSCIFRL